MRRLSGCLRHTAVLRQLDLRSFQALSQTCRAARQAVLQHDGVLELLIQVWHQLLAASSSDTGSDVPCLQAQLADVLDTSPLSQYELHP